jgi:hypothetical protein
MRILITRRCSVPNWKLLTVSARDSISRVGWHSEDVALESDGCYSGPYFSAFFAAHRFFCAAAIFFRAAALTLRFFGVSGSIMAAKCFGGRPRRFAEP